MHSKMSLSKDLNIATKMTPFALYCHAVGSISFGVWPSGLRIGISVHGTVHTRVNVQVHFIPICKHMHFGFLHISL